MVRERREIWEPLIQERDVRLEVLRAEIGVPGARTGSGGGCASLDRQPVRTHQLTYPDPALSTPLYHRENAEISSSRSKIDLFIASSSWATRPSSLASATS